MNYREIFGLAVRLLGLWFLFRGLAGLPNQLALFLRSILGFLGNGMDPTYAGTAFAHLLSAAWSLAVAYALFRGAPCLIRMTYPDAAAKPDPAGNDGTASGPKN